MDPATTAPDQLKVVHLHQQPVRSGLARQWPSDGPLLAAWSSGAGLLGTKRLGCGPRPWAGCWSPPRCASGHSRGRWFPTRQRCAVLPTQLPPTFPSLVFAGAFGPQQPGYSSSGGMAAYRQPSLPAALTAAAGDSSRGRQRCRQGSRPACLQQQQRQHPGDASGGSAADQGSSSQLG